MKERWNLKDATSLIIAITGLLTALYQIISLFIAPRLKPSNLILKAIPASQEIPIKPIIVFYFILLISSVVFLIYWYFKKK